MGFGSCWLLHSRYAAISATGRFDEALNGFDKARGIDPLSALSYEGIGSVLARAYGRLDEAIVHYKRALEIDAKMPLVEYNLGQVRVEQNRLDEAIAHYQKAITLSPRFALAHNAARERGMRLIAPERASSIGRDTALHQR